MSKINIKPLADRVLVEPSEAETKTSSGNNNSRLSKRETSKRKNSRLLAQVQKRIPVTLKTGDIVLYGKYAGTELNHNGVRLPNNERE
jgi:chaperonin GroES